MKPALVGLSFLAVCVAALARVVPAQQVTTASWFFVYLVLAASSLFTWHHPRAPRVPSQWLMFAVGALVAGAFFGGIDYVLHGPKMQSIRELPEASRGVVLELGLFLLASFVALAGWARSLVLPKNVA